MLITCSIFQQKTAMLTSRILKKSEFLKSQFMFVVTEQFTVTLEQRFQAFMGRSGSWQSENNHELQIIADFIVI